ncbi:MAG: hypothetical protein R6W91_05140 [Thermoplasmata archaeon]
MLSDWLVLELTQFQLYGLVFLLGSFTVATLSDLKYMKAQSEFVEVWVLSLLVLLAFEIWNLEEDAHYFFAAKWMLILIFILISNRSFGVLFKLARGDVMACAAVMSLLTPALVLVFIVCLKILDLITRPILRGFGKGSAYPFMPVVMATTMVVFGTVLYLV